MCIVADMSHVHPLQLYRKTNGLSREALAVILGTTATTIYRWEKQLRSPRIKDWQRISKITGIPVWELFGRIHEAAE